MSLKIDSTVIFKRASFLLNYGYKVEEINDDSINYNNDYYNDYYRINISYDKFDDISNISIFYTATFHYHKKKWNSTC